MPMPYRLFGPWWKPLDRAPLEFDREAPEDPAYDPEELYGVVPTDLRKQFDMREVIAAW